MSVTEMPTETNGHCLFLMRKLPVASTGHNAVLGADNH